MGKKQFTILFQGDSVTDCGRCNCGGAGFDNKGLGPGYPGMVTARLQYERPDVEWLVYNRGVSGHRTVNLYARWKTDAINLKPDLLSLLIGVNDTWHRFGGDDNGVEVPRAKRIYREMLEWTKNSLPDIKLILMEPFALDTGIFPPEGMEEMVQRRAFVRELAAEFGAALIPCQELLEAQLKRAPATYWTVEGVHPTPAGHIVLADAWLKAAKSLLPE